MMRLLAGGVLSVALPQFEQFPQCGYAQSHKNPRVENEDRPSQRAVYPQESSPPRFSARLTRVVVNIQSDRRSAGALS